MSRELSDVLFPFVTDYPSVNKFDLLQKLIKIKRAYPEWKNEKIAEYLKLEEIKKPRKTPSAKFTRQSVSQYRNAR